MSTNEILFPTQGRNSAERQVNIRMTNIGGTCGQSDDPSAIVDFLDPKYRSKLIAFRISRDFMYWPHHYEDRTSSMSLNTSPVNNILNHWAKQ